MVLSIQEVHNTILSSQEIHIMVLRCYSRFAFRRFRSMISDLDVIPVLHLDVFPVLHLEVIP